MFFFFFWFGALFWIISKGLFCGLCILKKLAEIVLVNCLQCVIGWWQTVRGVVNATCDGFEFHPGDPGLITLSI